MCEYVVIQVQLMNESFKTNAEFLGLRRRQHVVEDWQDSDLVTF